MRMRKRRQAAKAKVEKEKKKKSAIQELARTHEKTQVVTTH